MKLRGNERILIIRHDHLGDLVLSLPIARVLKNLYPNLVIDFLTSRYNSSVIKYADYVDGHLSIDNSAGRRLAAGELAASMSRGNYDLAIFARPDLPAAFAAYLAGIPLRIGTSRRAYSLLFNVRINMSRRRSNLHEVDLNLKLIEPFGLEVPPGRINPILSMPAHSSTASNQVAVEGDYVVVHPGTKGSTPNWPPEKYIDLAYRLSASMKVVITGQNYLKIEDKDNIINLIDKTNFDELIRMINNARLLVSGGTGPLHIAAALGRPVLGLYPDHPVLGPNRWGPRGVHTWFIEPVKQKGHKCRINDQGSCECMDSISVDKVLHKALDILAARE